MKLTYQGVIYSKKNSKSIIKNRRTGKPMIVASKRAKDMEKNMASEFSIQRGGHSVINTPSSVCMKLYRKDNIKRDLDNVATSVLDGLVRGEVIADDNYSIVKSLHIEDCGVDKNNPRVEIEINPW